MNIRLGKNSEENLLLFLRQYKERITYPVVKTVLTPFRIMLFTPPRSSVYVRCSRRSSQNHNYFCCRYTNLFETCLLCAISVGNLRVYDRTSSPRIQRMADKLRHEQYYSDAVELLHNESSI